MGGSAARAPSPRRAATAQSGAQVNNAVNAPNRGGQPAACKMGQWVRADLRPAPGTRGDAYASPSPVPVYVCRDEDEALGCFRAAPALACAVCAVPQPAQTRRLLKRRRGRRAHVLVLFRQPDGSVGFDALRSVAVAVVGDGAGVACEASARDAGALAAAVEALEHRREETQTLRLAAKNERRASAFRRLGERLGLIRAGPGAAVAPAVAPPPAVDDAAVASLRALMAGGETPSAARALRKAPPAAAAAALAAALATGGPEVAWAAAAVADRAACDDVPLIRAWAARCAVRRPREPPSRASLDEADVAEYDDVAELGAQRRSSSGAAEDAPVAGADARVGVRRAALPHLQPEPARRRAPAGRGPPGGAGRRARRPLAHGHDRRGPGRARRLPHGLRAAAPGRARRRLHPAHGEDEAHPPAVPGSADVARRRGLRDGDVLPPRGPRHPLRLGLPDDEAGPRRHGRPRGAARGLRGRGPRGAPPLRDASSARRRPIARLAAVRGRGRRAFGAHVRALRRRDALHDDAAPEAGLAYYRRVSLVQGTFTRRLHFGMLCVWSSQAKATQGGSDAGAGGFFGDGWQVAPRGRQRVESSAQGASKSNR